MQNPITHHILISSVTNFILPFSFSWYFRLDRINGGGGEGGLSGGTNVLISSFDHFHTLVVIHLSIIHVQYGSLLLRLPCDKILNYCIFNYHKEHLTTNWKITISPMLHFNYAYIHNRVTWTGILIPYKNYCGWYFLFHFFTSPSLTPHHNSLADWGFEEGFFIEKFTAVRRESVSDGFLSPC